MKRQGTGGRAALAMLPIVVVLASACTGEAVYDTNPSWDSDGDTISTAVELESHNRQLYNLDTLQFNSNYSRASGTRGGGSLLWGLNLPDTGFGYIHNPVNDTKDSDDWGTLALINTLEEVGRWFRRLPCQFVYASPDFLPREQIGDMSRQNGGIFYLPEGGQHQEHQNGLDVDVRYMRNDGQEGPLDLSIPSQALLYDTSATSELMSCFLQTRQVVRLYYDANRTGLTPPPGDTTMRHLSGHANHFHVSIRDPDGANN